MQDGLHLMFDFRVGSQLIESKQILFKIQIEIRLEITEPNWIVKEETLKLIDVGFAFNQNVSIKIEDYVI